MRFTAPTPFLSRPVRVCGIQYALRPVSTFDDFAKQVENFVDVGDDYDSDIIVFPELLGAQLLSCLPENFNPETAMRAIAERFSDPFEKLFQHLSESYDRILVAGTHPRLAGNRLENVASIFVPGHKPVHQPKLHLTRTERDIWKFDSGQDIHIVETDFGRFAVSICYDVQFPEVARIQAEQGVQLLIVPYLTDDRRGYTRVTTCARARAVENQFFVVTAGMVGSLPLITDLTAQYAQSAVFTPSDFSFPMDGVATEAAANVEMVLVSDLDLALLDQARARGSVLNHADAAKDGLHVTFDGEVHVHQLPWSDPSINSGRTPS